MSRFVRLCSLFFIAAFVAVGAHSEELIIYSAEAFPPQIYLADGKPAGIVAVLLQRLSQDTGDTYKLILLPWKRAISEATEGHGGIVNFSRTEKRKLEFDFSEPLFKNAVELTVLKQRAAEFRSARDFQGKIFGLPQGASFSGGFDQAVEDKIYTIDPDASPVIRVKKLLIGRIDVAILGQSYIAHAAKSDPFIQENQNQLAIVTYPLITDWEYLAFPKSMHMQPALRRFNKALLALKKTKEYQAIVTVKMPN